MRVILIVLFPVLLVAAPGVTHAGLTADQCVVIFNNESPDSIEIANNYARARDVPAHHLLGLDLPRVETLSRASYDSDVLPAVRRFLQTQSWGSRIRCLVTCYGVPLRIAAHRPTQAEKAYVTELTQHLDVALDGLRTLIERIHGTDRPVSADDDDPPTPFKVAVQGNDAKEVDRLYKLYLGVQSKLARRHTQLTGQDLVDARARTFEFIKQAEGSRGILDRAPSNLSDVDPASAVRIRAIRDRSDQMERRIRPMIGFKSAPDDFSRALLMLADTRGQFGMAFALCKRIASLSGDKTQSSFDSELALVLHEDQDPGGWIPNELHFSRRGIADDEAMADSGHRTLMVARLDGPTPKTVKRMIDDGLNAERQGLRGAVYIDARSTRKPGLIQYDRDLLDLAHIIRTQTSLPVVLNTWPEVFQPGECPDTALYCGWYSLEHYVDAFEFVPGAVAVHIASFELVSLRNPRKKRWCRELLQDGVAATFGATSEPYLQSFPLPTEFFCRLLTGQYTLVEAFFEAKPYNSWQLSLLGDPLYNPFKNNPQLSPDWNNKMSPIGEDNNDSERP